MQDPWSLPVVLHPISALFLVAGLSMNAVAQPGCDQLEVLSLRYAPFSDTTLQLTARALPGTLFNSPYFNLLDSEGDTVAAGYPWFFGMASVAQSHTLLLGEGAAVPPTPFTGTLEFNYLMIDGPVQCLLDMEDVDLCDIATCETFNPFAYRTGPGDPVTTSLDWHMTEADGAMIASGVFDLDALDQQTDFGEVCAAPGHYTLHVSQPVAVGNTFAFGVTLGGENFTVSGPNGLLNSGGQASVDFMFYPACMANGQTIAEERDEDLRLSLHGRTLILHAVNGQRIGPIRITDSSGRTIAEQVIDPSSVQIDLSKFASGAHILHRPAIAKAGQRFIIP